jgi:hypothetical protein
MFDALLFKKHRALYRQRIRSTPRWDYYAVVGLLGAALAGFGFISLIAMCVWAAWTARFFLQRLKGTSHRASHVAEMIVTSIAIPPLAVFWRLAGALKFRVAFA